jgi:hypothetical protein
MVGLEENVHDSIEANTVTLYTVDSITSKKKSRLAAKRCGLIRTLFLPVGCVGLILL